ncbi:uncharacterized protein [Littorina saxatilis]|uniref:Cyclic nucleotide-binding domain-containing protein n=1 Tax=Littorina saxatilis TaxID=31220 RepID=A0AAN9FZU1_9CAEN
MAMYNKVVNLISRPPQERTTLECQELVDWLKARSRLFATLKYDILTEIIRHCKFECREPDDIIIKQGERGDTLYIALQGDIGIYVSQKETFTDSDEKFNADVLLIATKAAEAKHLDRSVLGTLVFGGSCLTFGEVALVEQDCIRTASVVANTHLDLLTIDRDLFNRCLHGVVAEDMKAKSDFIERNVMFRTWPGRQKKQLVISLSTEKVCYGDKIIKQGQEADRVYFICSGEVEIHLEPKQYSSQYPRVWSEIQQFLPVLISETKNVTLMPHEDRISRLSPQRPQQICVLGENEHLGCMEVILGLDTLLETAVARSTVTLLKLRRQQFDRIFKRRYAVQTLETIKQYLVQRLCLYIYQCPPNDSAFLKFLNIRLGDAARLKSIKKSTYDEDKVFSGAVSADGKQRSAQQTELLKRLHMPVGAGLTGPSEDDKEVALIDLHKRLKVWSLNSQLNGSKILRLRQSHPPHSAGASVSPSTSRRK